MRGDGRIFQRGERWHIAFMRNGKEEREPSGSTNRAVAEKLLRKRQKEVGAEDLAGKPFETRRQRRVFVGELLDALETDYRLAGGRALPQLKSHLKRVRDCFGDMKAASVSSDAVDRYIESRLAENNPPAAATINRETETLRRAFRVAVKQRKLSAAPEVRRLKEENARQGFFERGDFEAVVERLPARLQDFARFAYLCGWRKGEIQSVLWSDVDRGGKVLRLRPEESKNGTGRVLALEGELWQLMERRWKAREYERPDRTVAFSLLIFHDKGEPIGEFRKSWATACKAADVTGRLFHDLRRTAVRNMIRAGVPERVAMSISGHKTRAVFDRYNIVSEADLREAMSRTQAYIANQPGGRNVVEFAKAAEGSR